MARRHPPHLSGMVLVDKPPNMTSHDVVAVLRRHFGERRIGHAGTLDPDATGLLVVGVGYGTRLLRFATAGTKTYECLIHLGIETDSLDASGKVTFQHPITSEPRQQAAFPQPKKVAAAAKQFLGEISQLPPMVSAVKVDGRRLHQLARSGTEIERTPRAVKVGSFEVTPTGDPLAFQATITCSAGTYVRVLGADLGQALGLGAHISHLRRLRSGDFSVTEAEPLPDDTSETITLHPLSELVRWMEAITLTPAEFERVQNGVSLDPSRTPGDGPWALLSPAGDLAAVHERTPRGVRPAVVIGQNASTQNASPPAPAAPQSPG